ncbi:TPA: Arm DNA-binding domain-containing protein, partial [Proteus mirabilis]
MKLTVKQVDSSKPKEKDYKLFDGGGLYLLVTKSGSKYWRLKYRIDGKEKVLAIGVYPTITLAEARKKRDDAKRQLSDGVDPNKIKKDKKRDSKFDGSNTFKSI